MSTSIHSTQTGRDLASLGARVSYVKLQSTLPKRVETNKNLVNFAVQCTSIHSTQTGRDLH